MLVCAIIRTVWLWKLVIAAGRGGVGGAGVVAAPAGGAGGRGAGNARGCIGDVAQVLTQCSDCANMHWQARTAISSFMFNYFIKAVRKLRASAISSSLTMCGRPG